MDNVSEVIRAALRHLEEDEARLAAFCSAIDEGDAIPDVADFDQESFINEMHVIFYRVLPEGKIRIIRILHERMDFPRHL